MRACILLFLLSLVLLALKRTNAADLPPGFTEETLATNLNAMTAMAVAPDGRIFLADQTGKLLVWKDGRVLDRPALTLHVTDFWERGLIGLTLHPDFPRTPQVFILYVTDQPFVHHVLSRFMLAGDTVDPATEKILFEGDDQAKLGGQVPAGHQGGPIRIGRDRRIYIGIGEQTAGEPSQRLDTLQGKILRLGLDGSIPADNPFFAQLQGKYRAIFARGVRNPYGLAVQPETGRTFFTDVGGSAFEEVNVLVPGANYGWPLAEGYSTNADFVSPLFAYPPTVGQCVSGGTFYPRSGPFPSKWQGKFFFLDYMRHWLRALDPDSPTNVVVFAKGFNGPIAVETAPDGSLIVLSRSAWVRDGKRFVPNAGSLVRIRYVGEMANAPRPVRTRPNWKPALTTLPTDAKDLPRHLSEAGVFSKMSALEPAPALLRCEVNLPRWEPGSYVRLWLAVPEGSPIHYSADRDWQLPPGTVVVRHYDWVMDATTNPSGPLKPLETRIIVIGAPQGYGASYRWKEDGSDAELVEDGDFADLLFARTQPPEAAHWSFPAIDESLQSPTLNIAYVTDLNTRQLNRFIGEAQNQLVRLSKKGWLEPKVSLYDLPKLSRLSTLENKGMPLELRVRSYLDANCAPCHQPGGAARGFFDARFSTPLEDSGIVSGPLAAGDLGIAGAQVVVPGDPDKSILFQRLKRNDFFRMPPTSYHSKTSPILPALEEWIRSLPPK
jgi:glucose/arabinose dehydrogenase